MAQKVAQKELQISQFHLPWLNLLLLVNDFEPAEGFMILLFFCYSQQYERKFLEWRYLVIVFDI